MSASRASQESLPPDQTNATEANEGVAQDTQTDEEDLKEYLGDTLVPLLPYALDELEKIRPPDPVLFLAHFLLRHNPRKSYQ